MSGGQQQTGLGRIFSELKRRRVTRVIVLYAVAGWIVIEVSSTVLPNLNLPDWSVTLVTVLVALGFVLAIMLACAFCGIHPIIMISSFAPMIMTLQPDPNLLAATFLFAWHLGTCSNPLSGTNLVFQGRYGIPGWKLAFWNWPYALAMLAVGALWLQLVARILP